MELASKASKVARLLGLHHAIWYRSIHTCKLCVDGGNLCGYGLSQAPSWLHLDLCRGGLPWWLGVMVELHLVHARFQQTTGVFPLLESVYGFHSDQRWPQL